MTAKGANGTQTPEARVIVTTPDRGFLIKTQDKTTSAGNKHEGKTEETVRTVDPAKIRAAIVEGDVFFKMPDYDGAISAYERGLELDPGNTILREKIQKAKSAKAAEEKLGTLQ